MNGKKAAGKEKLQAGDSVKLFLAEDTIEKFIEQKHTVRKRLPGHMPEVIYEDADVLLLNKPAGMLSQKAKWIILRNICCGADRLLKQIFIRFILESVTGWTGIHPDLLQRVRVLQVCRS